MKFKVENNWLLKTEEEIELNPRNFLYCSNIEELNNEICDFIHDHMKFPNMEKGYCIYQECLGTRFWDETYGEFMIEWQKLKGLPQEL